MQKPREILIESTQIGNSLRIVALDAATGNEVTFQAPATSSQLAIKRLAADKLNYVAAKKKG